MARLRGDALMLAAPRFIPRPFPDPSDEAEREVTMVGTFDLEWTQADPSVGETVTGYVAWLLHADIGDLMLTREQVSRALGDDVLREWESEVGREATEQ